MLPLPRIPTEPECHNALATVLYSLGQEADAERSLRSAIQLESKPHFHLSLAGVLRKTGRSDEALQEYQTALARGADPIETGLSIGKLQTALGDPKEARSRFREILVSDPSHAGALFGLRESLRTEGRKSEADEYLDRALEASPLDVPRVCGFAANRRRLCGRCHRLSKISGIECRFRRNLVRTRLRRNLAQ